MDDRQVKKLLYQLIAPQVLAELHEVASKASPARREELIALAFQTSVSYEHVDAPLNALCLYLFCYNPQGVSPETLQANIDALTRIGHTKWKPRVRNLSRHGAEADSPRVRRLVATLYKQIARANLSS